MRPDRGLPSAKGLRRTRGSGSSVIAVAISGCAGSRLLPPSYAFLGRVHLWRVRTPVGVPNSPQPRAHGAAGAPSSASPATLLPKQMPIHITVRLVGRARSSSHAAPPSSPHAPPALRVGARDAATPMERRRGRGTACARRRASAA
eukprot:CAMPEP_0184400514 /NCGR_PEP_ID=MMETSP0007-20130409/75066_1 /TAXON_ID=97485 /ORGANISM="Prymnesium parvum, Strain Texoma1" /LENGTH=145 /DNA_ID=CAMNT_0026755463 /DNA_START=216 /DNA_END=649 /DNA_ORIENTATION=-